MDATGAAAGRTCQGKLRAASRDTRAPMSGLLSDSFTTKVQPH